MSKSDQDLLGGSEPFKAETDMISETIGRVDAIRSEIQDKIKAIQQNAKLP